MISRIYLFLGLIALGSCNEGTRKDVIGEWTNCATVMEDGRVMMFNVCRGFNFEKDGIGHVVQNNGHENTLHWSLNRNEVSIEVDNQSIHKSVFNGENVFEVYSYSKDDSEYLEIKSKNSIMKHILVRQAVAKFDFKKELVSIVSNIDEADFAFSMPTLTENGRRNSTWETKYILILQNPKIQNFFDLNKENPIPVLYELLLEDKYAWEANLLLYSITYQNAVELTLYYPSEKEKWSIEKKDSYIQFWKRYIKSRSN